ncbi:transcriptional regulator with XRE-family HTH domain [Kitasatospora herbaricolor]|uniref:helix-turn-helix domain-containing protein n=1 Tax=Kitasatospora herbaricolor TaxID=68217 RepID=UPI00174B4B65|nr:XRE family transcriptional regulator [Kitasatospora herbaricolor]MDQ0311767.1 transcriptional regulator with XRE-family HTH domain [Kitasatospora herbaricolor]
MSESTRLLVRALREIKDANGWSLAETARRTHFSKASWERWLNGKRLITRQALDSLVKASGTDSALLTTLYEKALAEESSSSPPGASDLEPAAPHRPGAAEPGADVPAGPAVGVAAEPAEAGEAGEATAVEGPAAPEPTGPLRPPEGEDSPAKAAKAGPEPGRPGRRPRRRLRYALVAVGALAALLVALLLRDTPPWSTSAGHDATPSATATGHPAPAVAPPCQGVGCVGKDPQASGCAVDARTLLTGNIGERIIYLRYSQRCLAAWAAIKQGAPKDTATITTNSGQQQTAEIHWGYDNYSAMVDASGSDTTLQVCGVQPGGRGCTGVYNDPAHQPWPDPTDTGTPSGSGTPPAASTGSPAAGPSADAAPAAGPPTAGPTG